jgi:hypothetical protein
MTLTASLAEVTQALVDKLELNADSLGLKGIYYGDQNKLPITPIACVEPDNKDIISISPFRKVEIELTLYIVVYHSYVESPQANRQEADLMAESIETLIHADKGLLRTDGTPRVIHCYIKQVTSGYVKKGTSTVRASRLTFSARTQNQLPE